MPRHALDARYEIGPAIWPDRRSAVRSLFVEYAATLDVDLEFQHFQAELDALPGAYAPPAGGLWLATRAGLVCGCVAVRPESPGRCELKRLYVRPAERGAGLGLALAEHALAGATRMGYRRMCLDTLPSMSGAIALYRGLGFVEIGAYNDNPVPGVLFFERVLSPTAP